MTSVPSALASVAISSPEKLCSPFGPEYESCGGPARLLVEYVTRVSPYPSVSS